MRSGSELPESAKEIFLNKDVEYRYLQDYNEPDMDNVDALQWFVEEFGLSHFIESNEGTRIILSHPDFNYKISIESYGLGDTHSHCFSTSVFEE